MKNIAIGKLLNINRHIDKKNLSINYSEFFIKYTVAVSIGKHYGWELAYCPQCFNCQMLLIGSEHSNSGVQGDFRPTSSSSNGSSCYWLWTTQC